ncbi:uncharacterized protein AMSG_01068 [Thecamonas trahens ATCC 50062]|uniref:Uncharacterized protein n=1 Tax=Thecamonas trahens ATCC 50062 TaxID=461836 RepID=A0A0L0DIM7_THETB|nr:hypothetical protein AMSG_01068 [Thecamonas trahens ATCC 50062]KNC52239.1 hypothetical protein AMSG_01068 [Thecamonas trahens ATCC 50062]|eukprot:XP_013762241.1 hypothetical protein AMSG_01068 [Thecamonas trahens ATCC 50062]
MPRMGLCHRRPSPPSPLNHFRVVSPLPRRRDEPVERQADAAQETVNAPPTPSTPTAEHACPRLPPVLPTTPAAGRQRAPVRHSSPEPVRGRGLCQDDATCAARSSCARRSRQRVVDTDHRARTCTRRWRPGRPAVAVRPSFGHG